jgi:hypothetical protein
LEAAEIIVLGIEEVVVAIGFKPRFGSHSQPGGFYNKRSSEWIFHVEHISELCFRRSVAAQCSTWNIPFSESESVSRVPLEYFLPSLFHHSTAS